MSTLVITNTKKVLKYVCLFFLVLIGLYIGTILIQAVFNLGVNLGTILRNVHCFT